MVAGPVSQVCGPRPAAFPFDCDMIWGARISETGRRRAGGLALRCLERCARHAGDSASTAHRMTGQNLSHSAAVVDHLLI
jgi:hypothetical protein